LSEQLLAVAVEILAEEGWGRLNSDRVAARARAGKAGIYRRWPTMAALARAAVGRFRLVTTPEDTGSVRGDLRALANRWTTPLDREERAAASIVGAARYDPQLRAGLDEAPPADRGARQRGHGGPAAVDARLAGAGPGGDAVAVEPAPALLGQDVDGDRQELLGQLGAERAARGAGHDGSLCSRVICTATYWTERWSHHNDLGP